MVGHSRDGAQHRQREQSRRQNRRRPRARLGRASDVRLRPRTVPASQPSPSTPTARRSASGPATTPTTSSSPATAPCRGRTARRTGTRRADRDATTRHVGAPRCRRREPSRIVLARERRDRAVRPDPHVALAAVREPLRQPGHTAARDEASELRSADASGTQEWTDLSDADQRVPARRSLFLLPDLRIGRAVGKERSRHRLLLDRDTRPGDRAGPAGAHYRS